MEIEIERVHRAPGPKSLNLDRPRDIICRLYKYQQKEAILRTAWDIKDIVYEGAPVKILPDLSRATLQRRACLRPLLDLAREKGATYRWGYPLAVTFRKSAASFTLRAPAELPELFIFLETTSIQVPNWLLPITYTGNRGRPQMKSGQGRTPQNMQTADTRKDGGSPKRQIVVPEGK